MILEIKTVINTKGQSVVRVLSPGTIYHLFNHLKKTRRDYQGMQKTFGNEKATKAEKEQARNKWAFRARNLISRED